MKRSRVTSYIGILSLGLAIIPGVLVYFLAPGYNEPVILLLGLLFSSLFILPTIVCSYFELQAPKHSWNFYSAPKRGSLGRGLSLCYGIAFLLLGIVMPFVVTITSEPTLLIVFFLSYIIWIISGILGIAGAIVYRHFSQNHSSDERIINRKILLLLGIVMPFVVISASGTKYLIDFLLYYISWIISGILGIAGAIVYRDSPQNHSSDERIPFQRLPEHQLIELLLGRIHRPPLNRPPVNRLPVDRPPVNRPIPWDPQQYRDFYKPKEIYKINELVDLRLIENRTYLYVNNRRLMVCTFLLINVPEDKIQDYDEIKSIDEAAEILDKSLERTPPFFYRITPEEEFRAH